MTHLKVVGRVVCGPYIASLYGGGGDQKLMGTVFKKEIIAMSVQSEHIRTTDPPFKQDFKPSKQNHAQCS